MGGGMSQVPKGLDPLPPHLTIPCINDLYHMHDGVHRAHDLETPANSFGYCDGCDGASTLLFTYHSISTH
eukprot:4515807-Karenia_brevis.AAC.1